MSNHPNEFPRWNESAIALAIRVLNEALEADPDAINELMRTEVVVNTDALRDHWSVQVGPHDPDGRAVADGQIVVRPLGLINGLFGVDRDGWGLIAMRLEKDTARIVRFERLDRTGEPPVASARSNA